MATPQSLRITRGGRSFDLNTEPYTIGIGFSIPTMTHSAYIARGSLANVTGGGTRTAIKYNDRQWSFDIRITGNSDADVQISARRVTDFLYALDPNVPTYLEYRPNTDTPEPLWGNYGAAFHYEIVDVVDTQLWDVYTDMETRAHVALLTIAVEIKPFVVGNQQRIATATGGIWEDQIGAADGMSKGAYIPEAVTNKMTNPVFGYMSSADAVTYSNGWTVGSSLTATRNIDPYFVIPQTYCSMKVESRAASNNVVYQSINAGNTNAHSLSCYVKLPDGGAVSSTQVQLYYNTSLTTTYTAVGDGWYLLESENFSGINASTNTGVIVKNGYTIYATGFQLEEKAYSTPLAFGDMIGCAWTGSGHSSTSTRTAATCKISVDNDTVRATEGSVRLVVRFDVPNTHPNSMFLFDLRDGSHTAAPALYYNQSDDKLYFQSNTSTISASGALTFSGGTVYVIHATWGAAGTVLYVNGSQVDADAYVVNTLGASLFIGSDYSGGNQLVGAFIDVATFDRALTSTQVSNDYSNILQVITRSERPGTLPYFWTTSGDSILSLDTGKNPLGVVSGIPGNLPAKTEIRGSMSDSWVNIKSIVLSCFPAADYIRLANFLIDTSGTVGATDYGGQHYTKTVNSAGVYQTLSSAATTDYGILSPVSIRALSGNEITAFTRLYGSSASTFNLRFAWYPYGSTTNYYTDDQTITAAAGTAYRMYYTRPTVFNVYSNRLTNILSYQVFYYMQAAKITTTLDVSIDYFALLPSPVMILQGGDSGQYGFILSDTLAIQVQDAVTYPYLGARLTTIGSPIEFAPNKYNHLQCYFCPDGTVNPVTTYTATMAAMYITPRYALL